MNKTVAKLKRIGSSPIFLISIIALTLAAIVKAVGSTTLPAAMLATMDGVIASEPALDTAKQNLLPALIALPSYFFVSLAFSLFTVVGLWMYYSANRVAGDRVSTTGLTLIKILKTVEAVLFVVGAILFFATAAMTSLVLVELLKELFGGNMTVTYIVLAAMGGIALLAFILVIFYYRGIFRTIKSIKMTLATGVIMGKVSMYVIAANYVIAIFTLINAILSPHLLVLISGVLQTIGLVFLSIFMAKLHSEMHYIARRGGTE